MSSVLLDTISELMDQYNERVESAGGDEFVWLEYINADEYHRRAKELEDAVVDIEEEAETSLGCDYEEEA